MTWPLTPFYPPTTKPVRDGLYIVRDEGDFWLMRFVNGRWEYPDGDPTACQGSHWAGLAFDPVAVERIIDAECYPQRVRYLWVVPAP